MQYQKFVGLFQKLVIGHHAVLYKQAEAFPLFFKCRPVVFKNLFQFIGYFFGDVGDEAAFDTKGQRSKLMITRLILLIVGFLLAVAASGLELTQITIILGALGVGIGLGLQSIVNNFVSGIILIFDRPLRIGDTVEIGDQKGRVREISVRSSTLLTAEGAEVIIPNGDILSKNIVNWTFSNPNVRVTFSFATRRRRCGCAELVYENRRWAPIRRSIDAAKAMASQYATTS